MIIAAILAQSILLCSCAENATKNSSLSAKQQKSPETSAAEDYQEPMILTDCSIIDGTGLPMIEDGVIIISNGKIESIGKAENVQLPKDGNVIGLKGRAVLPGFFNAHVHRAYNEENLKNWLKGGVTTVRDLAPIGVSDFLAKRDKLNKNRNLARIVSATPIISPPGGYYSGIYVDSPEAAGNKTLEFIENGVDIIKLSIEDDCQGRTWPMLTLEVTRAIVDKAHSKNKKVSAHITHARNLRQAIDAGIDDIAHMVVEPLDTETVEGLVEKGIYWVPTLELWKNVSIKHSLDFDIIAVKNLSRFYKAGGKIALGTDFAGYYGEFDKGFPMTEALLMKEAGMTNMDIIVAATKNAAHVCDAEDRLGTLEAGKIADIVVVDGNPLKDLEVLKEPAMVIRDGVIVINEGTEQYE